MSIDEARNACNFQSPHGDPEDRSRQDSPFRNHLEIVVVGVIKKQIIASGLILSELVLVVSGAYSPRMFANQTNGVAEYVQSWFLRQQGACFPSLKSFCYGVDSDPERTQGNESH